MDAGLFGSPSQAGRIAGQAVSRLVDDQIAAIAGKMADFLSRDGDIAL